MRKNRNAQEPFLRNQIILFLDKRLKSCNIYFELVMARESQGGKDVLDHRSHRRPHAGSRPVGAQSEETV